MQTESLVLLRIRKCHVNDLLSSKLNELESPFNNFNDALNLHQSFCCCRISMYSAIHRNLDNQQSWNMDRDLYGHSGVQNVRGYERKFAVGNGVLLHRRNLLCSEVSTSCLLQLKSTLHKYLKSSRKNTPQLSVQPQKAYSTTTLQLQEACSTTTWIVVESMLHDFLYSFRKHTLQLPVQLQKACSTTTCIALGNIKMDHLLDPLTLIIKWRTFISKIMSHLQNVG